MQRVEKQGIYTRITNEIVSHLERGVRPWLKPWNAEHAAGRITRPLRYNGKPYSGINVLSLWASAMVHNFAAPIWMAFKQATELDGRIRKGEKGSLVVYADSITRKDIDDKTGDELEREIPFFKGYTVFDVDQIDGSPAVFYAKAAPRWIRLLGSSVRIGSSPLWVQLSATAGIERTTASRTTSSRCHRS